MVERYFDPVTGRIKLLNWVEVRLPRDNGRRPTGRDVKQARGASPPEWAGTASPARLWEIPYTLSRQSNKPGREM